MVQYQLLVWMGFRPMVASIPLLVIEPMLVITELRKLEPAATLAEFSRSVVLR